jgi:hypothetical protein
MCFHTVVLIAHRLQLYCGAAGGSLGLPSCREGQAGSSGFAAACVSELGQTAFAILSEPKIVILDEKRPFSKIFSTADIADVVTSY